MSGPGAHSVVDLIARKRDGGALSAEQIDWLIEGYVADRIPDYQMSALLMAILLRGMDARETLALTEAMVASGDQVDLSALGRRIVDKHSTGGVGDKVSLALAPIVASCGVPFGKMSGRGLGHTGGTLDKLESIPGFQVELTQDRFIEQVQKIGVAIVGQTANIVPADKRLYALRDVTATVDSLPLIAASIMSKKLAAGADAIVLDVKVGSGAFMKDIDSARDLADTMIEIGAGAGREVKVLLSDMSKPLGRTVGNGLEIAEVVQLLEGNAADDLLELVLTAASVLLSVSDLQVDEDEARSMAMEAIASGRARTRYDEWITAQDGDPEAPLPRAEVRAGVFVDTGGFVEGIDALTVGRAAAALGAGRQTKDDVIDHGVGVEIHASIGDTVEPDRPVMTVHAQTDEDARIAAAALAAAMTISANPVEVRPIVLERRG